MSDKGIFSSLTEDQLNELEESLAYITILIAGADGNIDEQELNWAEKLTHIRSYKEEQEFMAFYGEADKHLSAKLEELMNTLPQDLTAREKIIADKLARLNNILPLLDNHSGHHLYKGLLSFAKHIAKASGGFLRFGSIGRNERKWIGLPMIHPIILLDEEEN